MAREVIMAVATPASSLPRGHARCAIFTDRPCDWPVARRRACPGPRRWAAPRFPDSGFGANSCCTLPVQVLVVDFLRSPVAKCRMETRSIVPELDVPRNVLSCFSYRRVHGTVDPLDFYRGIE